MSSAPDGARGPTGFGASSRPPKTRRPWPVPRTAAPDGQLVRERWAQGRPTPWVDAVEPAEAEQVPPGAPPTSGTADGADATDRLRYTFVVEAPGADEVLLWANRLSDETDLSTTLMERVPGTDLWVASFLMPRDWIASYCFLPARDGVRPWALEGDQVSLRAALDQGGRDSRNPSSSRNRAGVPQSVVAGPAAPTHWLEGDPDVPALPGWTRRELVVEGRNVVVHGPSDDGPLPILVLLDGEVWETHHGVVGTVARLVGEGRLRPHRLVLVGSGGRERRWSELAAGEGGFVHWIADVLLPAVGAAGNPADVTVAGQSLGGLTALRAALRRPDAVGWCLAQSASTWVEDLAAEAGGWNALPGRGGVHLSVGAQEWVLASGHVALDAAFNAPRGVDRLGDVRVQSYQGGHDYAWWRHALADALLWQEGLRRARA